MLEWLQKQNSDIEILSVISNKFNKFNNFGRIINSIK